MLDGAFFAKKNHPSRLLVNALAEAGRGWTPVMGTNDPLYSHIDAIVHRILDGFTDDLTIFDEAREKLERFLADEEQAAEANIQSTAEEIDQTRPRAKWRRSSPSPRSSGASRCTRSRTSSRGSSASNGSARCRSVYLTQGEESEPWEQSIAMLEDLVWSVQPKRTKDDRKHLVALLPALLKRLTGGPREDRLAAGRARAVHGEPRRGARGVGEAHRRHGDARDGVGRRAGEGRSGGGEGRRRRGEGGEGRGARRGDDAGRAGAGRSRRSSTTSSSRSRRISSAARGSSSRPTTASSRSRSSRGSARCAAPTCSPTARG